MRLTAITNQPSRDPSLVKRSLNGVYGNRLTELNRKSQANKMVYFGDFQKAKKFLDNGCPQLEDGIDYKSYRSEMVPGVSKCHLV